MGLLQEINDIKLKQQTISDLIKMGEVLVKSNGLPRLQTENGIDIKTVFDTDFVSVTIASCPEEGLEYPSHYHEKIIEYLICLKGAFGVTLPHNGYRILKEKECAKIPANVMHSVISLEKDSDIMGICLPAEPAYTKDIIHTRDLKTR